MATARSRRLRLPSARDARSPPSGDCAARSSRCSRAMLLLLTLAERRGLAAGPPFPDRPARRPPRGRRGASSTALPEQGARRRARGVPGRAAGIDIVVLHPDQAGRPRPGRGRRRRPGAAGGVATSAAPTGTAPRCVGLRPPDRRARSWRSRSATGSRRSSTRTSTCRHVMRAAMADALRSATTGSRPSTRACSRSPRPSRAGRPRRPAPGGLEPRPDARRPRRHPARWCPTCRRRRAGRPTRAPSTGVRGLRLRGRPGPATRQRAAATIAAHRGPDGRPGRRLHPGQARERHPRRRRSATRSRSSTSTGVGREGFDDGLAILFDLDESLCHGQVQLYAAPGYRASYLTNEDRQAIFEQDMLPHLRDDLRPRAARSSRRLASIDAATTAERAQPAPAGAPGGCGDRPGRWPRWRSRPGRLGRLELAPVRTRPAVPRRPVDAHARAAARPDAGRGDRGARRPCHAARADHGAGRPGRPRRAAVPRSRARIGTGQPRPARARHRRPAGAPQPAACPQGAPERAAARAAAPARERGPAT